MKEGVFILLMLVSSVLMASGFKAAGSNPYYLKAEPDTFITNSILKEKDGATALVLCILTGPLGVHRIYLGTSKTTAIAYILTGAGFGILWIADTILILKAILRKDMSGISNNRHYFLWNR